MSGVVRFSVSMDGKLLEGFDRLIRKKGYTNRSEAIRDIIRDKLVQEEWESGNRETVGSITLVYSHEVRELTEVLTELQHKHYMSVISSMHIHLDEHNCLEVLVVRGKTKDIRSIADGLIGTRGVKHGKLTLTTTGKDLV